MVRWHHRLNGHEFEWTPEVGDGQGGLACCSPWGHKESDMTEQLNWTENLIESPLDSKEIKLHNPKGNQPKYSLEGLMLKLQLATWCEELTHWKRPWCWERLKAGGEGGNRGWGGWMASPTPWTWVWANSRRQWRTGKPDMLQSIGSPRVRHDFVTEQGNLNTLKYTFKYTFDPNLQKILFFNYLVSYYCYNTLPPVQCLKTTPIYDLKVLEDRRATNATTAQLLQTSQAEIKVLLFPGGSFQGILHIAKQSHMFFLPSVPSFNV